MYHGAEKLFNDKVEHSCIQGYLYTLWAIAIFNFTILSAELSISSECGLNFPNPFRTLLASYAHMLMEDAVGKASIDCFAWWRHGQQEEDGPIGEPKTRD